MAIAGTGGNVRQVMEIGWDSSEVTKGVRGLEKDVGKSQRSMSKTLAAGGKTATRSLTVPILGIGAAAVGAFNKVAEGSKAVTVGTGAQGKALADLQKSYKRVAGSATQDLGEVGATLAEMNTRTGATKDTLEDLTGTVLDASRMLGGDAVNNTKAITRAMGDWGVEAEDGVAFMDKLFVAGQKTGIGMDQLSKQLVQYGAPLRQMGFGIDTATALLGKFEKEGVNAELVMGSLRIALGKMAKEGIKDPEKALAVITKRIKEAGSAGEANKIALETFGSRAGPDMAAAIREGRFEVEDLTKALGNSQGAISKTNDATTTSAERMKESWNKVMIAAAPLGELLGDLAATAAEKLGPAIQWLSEEFQGLGSGGQTAVLALGGFLIAIGPVMSMTAKMINVLKGLKIAVLAVNTAMRANPALFIAGALIALGAALVVAYKNSETFRKVVDAAFAKVRAAAERVAQFVTEDIPAAFGAALDWVKENWPEIATIISGPFAPLVALATDGFGVRTAFMDGIKGMLSWTRDKLRDVQRLGQDLSAAFVRGVKAVAWDWPKLIKERVVDVVTQKLAEILGKGKEISNKILLGIKSVEWAIGRMVRDRVIQPLIDKMAAILDKGKDVSTNLARGIRQGATDAWDLVKSKFASLLNSIITVINKVPFVDIAPIKLAQGTITTRPTLALIGEDGPEAVIPLSRKHRQRGEHLMGLAQGMMGQTGESPGPLGARQAMKLADRLGIPMLGLGGIFGAAGNYAADRAKALAGAARDGAMAPVNFARNQLGNLIGQIPTPSIGQPVIDGALRYVRDAAVAFVKGLQERKDTFSFSYGPAREWSERAMGLRYIWGGGHGGWNWGLPGYDCSGGASHAYKKAGGNITAPGTTFSLFPQTRIGADGGFKLGFRGMGSSDPRSQHMGWKIGDTWYQFGPRKGGSDSQWTHVGVPNGLPGYLAGTDYVPGAGLRMLHGGETVLNRQDAAAYRAGKAGTHVTVTIGDAMAWLRDFITTEVDDYAGRSRRYGIAAGGVR